MMGNHPLRATFLKGWPIFGFGAATAMRQTLRQARQQSRSPETPWSGRLPSPPAFITYQRRPLYIDDDQSNPKPLFLADGNRTLRRKRASSLFFERVDYSRWKARFFGRQRACQLTVFSSKLPSMEAEIDCKLQSNSR